MSFQHVVQAKIDEIAATADQHPGIIIIHHVHHRTVEYMSAMGLALLQTTQEELLALGADYHSRFFNAEESAEYVPKIWALVAQNDFNLIVSFFQQVRTAGCTTWSWFMSTVRLLLRGEDGLPLLIISYSCPIDADSHVTAKVQRLLDENNFLRQNGAAYSRLTLREREILRLLALGYSAREIAQGLFISVQTVETHRRNLRQKLGADSLFELGQYARAFDLI
ncbi:LuxR family transcriptional regulator [Hymenobacter busanensis]|uniref:LuxR family transcriptional regulator n=1 Tax=Hymenobacter busanensis TaxID=2607656 RepID=A0A7L5A2C9_9BACT|nr:LuxR C-terminal-related transcriptional regulator [Hymenobacter busanensis]KAA9327007.1 LuxR family transcriptional regulator [Hymenobacter busanensis]QHJ09457.1 LuxR family transcriptional regulator [Hymenobacter busanensis]